jgi:hypothetical protein
MLPPWHSYAMIRALDVRLDVEKARAAPLTG